MLTMESMNENKEIWKDIPGYEGWYQVSNIGRVKSLDRLMNSRNGAKAKRKGQLLKLQETKLGYMQIMLYANGNKRLYSVHRLVMMAFYGQSDLHVNHKNLNKKDNRVENLEYVNRKENSQHYWDLVRTGQAVICNDKGNNTLKPPKSITISDNKKGTYRKYLDEILEWYMSENPRDISLDKIISLSKSKLLKHLIYREWCYMRDVKEFRSMKNE